MTMSERFVLVLLVLWAVGMGAILYHDMVWKPRATSEIYHMTFTDEELEFESGPDFLTWARPTDEARPKYWNLVYCDKEWCWAWENEETGRWSLSRARISPEIKEYYNEAP
jgi:hypothetical protein